MTPSGKVLPLSAAIAAVCLAASQPTAALMTTPEMHSFSADQDASDTLSFDYFDSSLGTLTSVVMSIDSSWYTTFNIDYSGPEGDGGTISGGSTHSLQFTSYADTDSGTSDLGTLSAGCSGFLPSTMGATAECHDDDDGNGTLSGDVPTLFSFALDPNDYIGTGTFDMLFEAFASELSCYSELTDSEGPSPTCMYTTSWNGSVELVYYYDEAPPEQSVPEPGTGALLGLGLAGLGLARRRRKGRDS